MPSTLERPVPGSSLVPAARPPRPPRLARLVLVCLATALTVVAVRSQWRRGRRAEPAQPRPVTPRADLYPDEKATIEIFKRASGSVVYITSLARSFFARSLLEMPSVGSGSGFCWDSHGHIVTNYHVISGADSVAVVLPDRTRLPARVVGAAPDKDLAVLRVDASEGQLTPLALGSSSDLQVGQRVLAIGNPFGFDYTLTTGVVSALGREIESFEGRTIQDVIQTDAAINPGNSGGPLLDSAGRLIGVNTQIASPSGASAGIGFSVPVDTVNKIVPQLIKYGRVIRPDPGVAVHSDHFARRIGIYEGVLIDDVIRGSAADRAGLLGTTIVRDGRYYRIARLGDVIVSVAGQPVGDQNAYLNALERHEIGEEIEIGYIRDGRRATAMVTLESGR
ncbi:MAG: PDZ domain-containing protein [Phycisphaerales bacterium]|nr:MAG: PDZ domain-containing protein [Phycisphaerales bacterium]